jgi:hypothetical protein
LRAAVERLADPAHLVRHRLIADAHLAQIVVHVAAERVEHALCGGALRGATRGGAVAQPPQHQDEVQHDHVESAEHCVGNRVILVEYRMARLRHDGAIERRNGGVGWTSE